MSIKKSNFLLTTISAFFFISLLFFNACTEDLCEGVDCGEHGENCVEGTCICEFGWYSDGGNCNKVDSCVINGTICGTNASCNSETGACECDAGWYGADCDSNDPCANPDFPGCVLNASCGTDPDTGEAACFCDDGFELSGEECVATIGKYYGVYAQTDVNCVSDVNAEYVVGTVTIVEHPTDEDKINLENFGGFGHTVFATVIGNNFEIPEQTYANPEITYKGFDLGSYNVGELDGTVSLSIRYSFESATSEICDAVLVKQ